MSTAECTITPGCTFGKHQPSEHPCGRKHIPGSPCAYCGKPTPLDGDPCWDCWTPIAIADFKAIAANAGLDTAVTIQREDS